MANFFRGGNMLQEIELKRIFVGNYSELLAKRGDENQEDAAQLKVILRS